jgi:RNA polymerase sigma-70 factor (ECF subfamily)
VTPDADQLATRYLAAAQAGDAVAYDALLRLLAEAARVFVGRRIAWAEWGEDVVQDILLTVHRVRQTYDPARPFGPWFYAIASARLIDALRARRRVLLREVADEGVLDNHAADPHPDAPLSGLSQTLSFAVASLPRVQREVVSLLKYEDLSVREVAGRLGMSEAAVKTTAHRGYARLRSKVKGRLRENR